MSGKWYHVPAVTKEDTLPGREESPGTGNISSLGMWVGGSKGKVLVGLPFGFEEEGERDGGPHFVKRRNRSQRRLPGGLVVSWLCHQKDLGLTSTLTS